MDFSVGLWYNSSTIMFQGSAANKEADMENSSSSDFQNKLSKHIINTPSPAARISFFYMQEAGCLKAEDAAISKHKDIESFLIAAVVSGRGELTVGSEKIVLIKGDCFFIDSRTPYCYKSSDTDPWEIMWIHFSGSTSQQYYDYFISDAKNIFRPRFFDKVVSAIDEVINVNEKKSPETEIITSKLIVDLLTDALTAGSNDNEYDSALNHKLAAVSSYIDDHFTEDLSLERLSSEFYISKYYLTREYKRIYGKTIFQHIITARINYGKKLLRFSDMSVEEVAHLCGFNDQSYFARQFKKAENLTCFSYRKIWRE